jgi:uncharacterized Ntn-hydrolase superfamily protein
MRTGSGSSQALSELVAADEGRDLRQVAMVDAQGTVAAHTGSRCIAEAGHELGDGFSVQANMMANAEVWPAMARGYREAPGDLAERLLAALDAAQKAGGDVRGKQSAAMLIAAGQPQPQPWEGILFELRVEDHPEPLQELRRLVSLQRAYEHSNRGDELLGQDRVEEALQEYRVAAEMAPQIAELPFWHAVALADLDRMDEALSLFRNVFARDPNLVTLVQRLPASGLLRDDAHMMARILAVAAQ